MLNRPVSAADTRVALERWADFQKRMTAPTRTPHGSRTRRFLTTFGNAWSTELSSSASRPTSSSLRELVAQGARRGRRRSGCDAQTGLALSSKHTVMMAGWHLPKKGPPTSSALALDGREADLLEVLGDTDTIHAKGHSELRPECV